MCIPAAFSFPPGRHRRRFPTPGIIAESTPRITELLSCRCYTGLGFSILAEELPGRASREAPSGSPPLTVWRASG